MAAKVTKAPLPKGRPSLYSPDLAQDILDRLSNGETLASICRTDDYPAYRTISDWKGKHPQFSADFARAREDGEDVIAENIRLTARGVAGYSSNDVQRDKLIVETDLKLLAKWNPKKYGDKIEHSGNIGVDLAAVLRERRAKRADETVIAIEAGE